MACRLWVIYEGTYGLYGLYGPRSPLSPERPLNLITHSPTSVVIEHFKGQSLAFDDLKLPEIPPVEIVHVHSNLYINF